VDIITVPAKNIIFKVKKPNAWFGAEYNMNIYRGCSHGCIYCDSRSDCYKNDDFDNIKVKENALLKIRDDLKRKIIGGVVATGAMSDPYNPFEKELKLTRNALELINAFEFGVAIDTKSPLVARDKDILRDITEHSPVIVKMTITTNNPDLCAKVEPNAANPEKRFEALKELSDAGIFCGVLMMPVLPFINDTEENISQIVCAAKKAGAEFIYPAMGMTLRGGNREYYYAKLDEFFPGVKDKYIKQYGTRYQCLSPKAKRLWNLFKEECASCGILSDMQSIIQHYKSGYKSRQLEMFDSYR
jgi:DNA repair photolyase